MKMQSSGISIRFENSRYGSFRKKAASAGLLLAAASLFALSVLCRNSTYALVNRLFEVSERVNSYAYKMLNVPEGTPAFPAAAVFACGVLGSLLYAFCSYRALPIWIISFAAVSAQVYFGLSLPAYIHTAFMCALLLKLAEKKNVLFILTVVLSASFIVIALFPGVHVKTEELSERARDFFSSQWQDDLEQKTKMPEGVTETRPENLRSLSVGGQEAALSDSYELITVEQVEISKPYRLQLLRIILLCLSVPLALMMPFLPFVWMNVRIKRTRESRAKLISVTEAESIRACFLRISAWLDLFGEGSSQSLYINRFTDAPSDLPAEYTELYSVCADIWQEAEYSGHEMTYENSEQVLKLLNETEKLLFEKAGRLMRFRLKYIYCLYSQEKTL